MVAPLIAILLVLGVYPKPALDVINPAVSHTLTTIDQQDPAPRVAARRGAIRKRTRNDRHATVSRVLAAVADADRVRRRRRRRARRGVPAPRRPLPGATGAGHRRSTRRAGRRRQGVDGPALVGGSDRRRRRRRRRQAGAVPAGHAAAGRHPRHAADGRTSPSRRGGRRGRRERPGRVHLAGRRGAGQRRREDRHESRCRADGDLPADDVRARRHDVVPGLRRPADDVHRARGVLAAAVPDVRPGPAATAALPGGRAEVLPARRVLVGVLPLRHRPALRLLRRVEPQRDPRRGRHEPGQPRRWR